MKTITNSICAVLVALTLGGISTASALTVYPINNGFEQPDLGSGCDAYQYNPPSPGWTFYGGGIAANESCFDVAGATNGNNDNHATSSSGQAALLQGGDGTLAGSFSQTLNLPVAGNWILYFSLEGRPYYDGPNGVNVFVDGFQVGSTLFPANLGSFNGASLNLGNLTAGSHTIGFAGIGDILGGDRTTFVDNVRLANGATGDLFASINYTQNGQGAIYDYTPLQTTFASSGLLSPRGVAFDSVGNFFVATSPFDDPSFQATIVKIAPEGTQSAFATLGNYFLEGVAIDRSDNVFVMALNQDAAGVTIFKVTPGGVTSTFATPPSIQSFGLTFDSTGNLYTPVNFASGPPQIWKFRPDGTSSVFATASSPDLFLLDLAFDRFGNLFVSAGNGVTGQSSILRYAPNGTESTFATGLNAPRGLAFDNAGNLFVAEIIQTGPGDILKLTPSGKKSVFASGIGRQSGNGGPEFLAIQPARPAFNVVAQVPLQTNALAFVSVNEALNKIYTSGGASGGQDVVVIDGTTFAATDVGTGSGASVDVQTSRYWAANVYGGGALVRDGSTDNVLATIPLSYCPINTAYDSNRNREWVGAQCGPGNDPVFAIDAATFNVVAGPIASGGVMGNIIANGATGRLYLTASGVSKRVDPTTFRVTSNAFGQVRAVNAVTNRLYAVNGTNLQIINGATNPERILTTITLSYSPASMGVNTALNHLYLANPVGNNIEVRNGSTGALIATFSLGPLGANPDGAMAVDSTRGRIYAIASSPSGPVLLVIKDLTQ